MLDALAVIVALALPAMVMSTLADARRLLAKQRDAFSSMADDWFELADESAASGLRHAAADAEWEGIDCLLMACGARILRPVNPYTVQAHAELS
jgi:hypothetical protein